MEDHPIQLNRILGVAFRKVQPVIFVLSPSLQIERSTSSTTRPMTLSLDPFEMVHPAPTITPAQVCYFEKRSYFVGNSFYSIESHSWSCLSKSATSSLLLIADRKVFHDSADDASPGSIRDGASGPNHHSGSGVLL